MSLLSDTANMAVRGTNDHGSPAQAKRNDGNEMLTYRSSRSAKEMQNVLVTNVVGVHVVTCAFLPLLRKGGGKKICNM